MTPDTPAAARSSWPGRLFCYGVPLFYLAVVLTVQQPHRLMQPDGRWCRDDFLPDAVERGFAALNLDRARWLYDDNDLAAIALRGLNAQQGRTPGRLDEPSWRSWGEPFEWLHELRHGTEPPAERFFLEYPPLMLAWFRLGWFAGPGLERVPTVVLDAQQHDIVYHVPETVEEAILWQRFRWAARVYACGNIACLLLLIFCVRSGYKPGGGLRGPAWLLLLPATLYFTLGRFDIMPAAFLALALWLFGRERYALAGVCHALATLMKVFPGFIAPLLFGYLVWTNRQALLRWTLAIGLTFTGLFAVPILIYGLEPALNPFLFQLQRDAEFGWTLYAFDGDLLLPRAFGVSGGDGSKYRSAVLLALLAYLAVLPPAGLASVLRRGAVVLALFVSLQVFFSPQWVVWLGPLLVPLAGRRGWAAWAVLVLTALLDVVMYASFPLTFDYGYMTINGQADAITRKPLIYWRFALLAGLSAVLLLDDAVAVWRQRTQHLPEV